MKWVEKMAQGVGISVKGMKSIPASWRKGYAIGLKTTAPPKKVVVLLPAPPEKSLLEYLQENQGVKNPAPPLEVPAEPVQ